jgi:hypothetical protein
MREAAAWIGFVAGLIVVLGTAGSLVRTLILPRGLTSRLAVFVGRRLVWRSFLFVANRFESYETKDKILALSGPVSLLALLVTWLLSFFLGFALLLWPLIDGSFAEALRESGSSLLTLGIVGGVASGANVVYFVAAATGLIVVALQIAYLPTLYASFNRRETLVTLLQSRAGAPAWGPEILVRAHMVGLMPNLPDLYAEWERWAADVAESHTNYPVLVWWRSPHPLRSWILALIALMDSAALYNAIAPKSAPIEGRLVIRMGFTCLRSIAEVMRIPFDPDPLPTDPIELTYEEFAGGVHRLESVGFPMERTIEEAWDHFKGWRVNYERVAYALADAVVAPPGPWSGERRHLPGMAIVPERPPDRRPGDLKTEERPKATRSGWHA